MFRMAKTFTGDVIFDQLFDRYYSLLAKATANSGPMATTTGLPPDYCAYDTGSHFECQHIATGQQQCGVSERASSRFDE
jgi:hypothetical protein